MGRRYLRIYLQSDYATVVQKQSERYLKARGFRAQMKHCCNLHYDEFFVP